MEMEAAPQGSQFLNRVLSLPIVASALEKSTSAYQRSKQSYPIVGKTLSMTEGTVTYVYGKSKPLLMKLEGPARAVGVNKVLSVADELAVKALEKVETKLPVITQPTDKVVEVVFDYADNVKARVTVVISPITERVRTVTVTLMDKLSPVYEFVMTPIRPVYIRTNIQLEAFTTMAVQLIWVRPMTSVQFYVADLKTRRERIQELRAYRLSREDEPEDVVPPPPTLESLDEGYAYGLHLIYANIANRILTWESAMTPIISSIVRSLTAPRLPELGAGQAAVVDEPVESSQQCCA